MAKKVHKTEANASVVMSSESVIMVHAFLQIHAPKLAAKFASKFENLGLEEHADQAETLSNALVNTVKAAMLVPGTDVSKALSSLSKNESEPVEEAEVSVERSEPPETVKQEKKKTKLEKKEKKRKHQEEETEHSETAAPEQAPGASEPEPTAPSTEAEVSEPAESRPKKKSTQGERFQRVKSDNVQFLDDRLRDMSYEAKVCGDLSHMQSGAGDWGARANADLIMTRGKAFTKEKNKKKRGSYRGGVIDQGSHSIKFTYDDE
ncbi:jun-like transcription factor [Malassezia caprae]|uniref:Jun-like transcription factor n=1 Tax=Malassezia caprae TaxID=1381934 RepID=A0AAF0E5G4_9BASI|nr:jun-like transcription factor [Malassezia caprae]